MEWREVNLILRSKHKSSSDSFIHQTAVVCVSCSVSKTLCDAMDCSPPGSSLHGILQARILEWVLFPPPRDLPDPGNKPRSPALQADSLPPVICRLWGDEKETEEILSASWS